MDKQVPIDRAARAGGPIDVRAWPPTYFTPDWTATKASVERLVGLEPEVMVPGHSRRGPTSPAAAIRHHHRHTGPTGRG